MTTPVIGPTYGELLHAIQPKAIHNQKEHSRLFREIQKLMRKGEENLTPAELAMLEVLATLVEDYEKKTYPRTKSTPAQLLEFLMEQNNLKAADLPLPAPRVSEILAGKRKISKSQAVALAKRFKVSPELFRERLTF
jgi:HTH-type transcriptional regulator/antitoxin HigA